MDADKDKYAQDFIKKWRGATTKDELGRETNTPIEYYLNGEKIGETLCVEASFAIDRIKAAKAIGIDRYDDFCFLRGGEKVFGSSVIIAGKPMNDFEQPSYLNSN